MDENREYREKRINKNKTIRRGIDTSLIVSVIFLICFGLVMIYSTSSYEASMKGWSPDYYLRKQIQATFIGAAVMMLFTFVDYHFWKRFAVMGYIVSIVCFLLILTPLGIEANGAKRWIGISSFSFQPAELAKVALILIFAALISQNPKISSKLKSTISMFGIMGVLVLCILVITKNLSSAIIVGGIGYSMLALSSKKTKWYLVLVAVVGTVGFFALQFLGGFRAQRLLVWQDPVAYSKEGGYQTLQALYAIGSGGFFGKGLGQSVQKLGFVPEAQNDMVFAIICEELGIFGGIAIILLFAFLIWRILSIASKAEDLFGSMIATGVLVHIALQVALNIAVVTNTIPNTGVTLPFISYGGTSTLFLMAEMGLVLSVSRGGRKARRQVVVDDAEEV